MRGGTGTCVVYLPLPTVAGCQWAGMRLTPEGIGKRQNKDE